VPPEGGSRRGVGYALRPLRRFLSRLALVDEKQDAVRREVAEVAAYEGRILQEVKTLRAELGRVRRENAAVLRLVAGPKLEASGPDSGEWPAVMVLPGASRLNRQTLFSELERGSRGDVMATLEGYVPMFEGRAPVIDLGCGRGEFLELAGRRGLRAYGVDTDADAIAACRTLGLDARQEDLFEHLPGLAAASVGGVFCSQVVEHLPPDLLPELLEEIGRVLVPGGVAVVETPNPATFATHVQSFWRDPTHIRPVPAVALAFAARTAGLVVRTTVYGSLPPDSERLKVLDAAPEDSTLHTIVEAFNGLTAQLNELLYGYQDYALVLEKPA
jgi:O-antigen chain-terminating methyltransferase